MVLIYTPVFAIVAGKINMKLNVCVIHLWFVPDYNKVEENLVLDDERLLQGHGKNMKEDYPTIPRSDVSLNNKGHNRLIYDELRYDINKLGKEHRPLGCVWFLYAMISRVTWRNGLKILLIDENSDCINTTSNVVYQEIFQNV
ncbi:hypothetical protein MTR_3g114680 [Medicago truncatula]|uniref:Uncharacterized protein n=1 Tax=Medicago truncatula TaxID=3880 RepID=G7J5W2_MEDTR|nr:hypothetical protein MTR_3g114680 [Medicago truncatula]